MDCFCFVSNEAIIDWWNVYFLFLFCLLHLAYLIISASIKSSHTEAFCKRDVLKNIAKFTEKQLHQSLFFNEVEDLFNRMPLVAASVVHLSGKSITAAVAAIVVAELFWMLCVIRLWRPQKTSNLMNPLPPYICKKEQ